MRTALLVAVALASSQGTASEPDQTAVVVKAWSSTAGPYGVSWTFEIEADGAASVTRWRAPGETGQERDSTVAPEDRSVMTKAVEVAEVERFKRACNAVVKVSPIKPPIWLS